MSLSDLWADLKIAHTLMGDLPVLEQCVDYGMKAVDDGKATMTDIGNLLAGVHKIMDDAQGKQEAPSSSSDGDNNQTSDTFHHGTPTGAPTPSTSGVTADDLNKQELYAILKSVPWDYPGKPQS